MLGHVQIFVTLWTGTLQAALSMEFSRQTTRVGCHFLLYGIFPTPGIKPESLVSPALVSVFFTNEPPGKLYKTLISEIKGEPNK